VKISDCVWTNLKYANRAQKILAAYIPPGAVLTSDPASIYGGRAFTSIVLTGSAFTNYKVESSVDGVLLNIAGSWATLSLLIAAMVTAINGLSQDYQASAITLVTTKRITIQSPSEVGYKNSVITITLTSGAGESVFMNTMIGGLYQRIADDNCLTNNSVASIYENVQSICGCDCVDSSNDIIN
jgi:hypothetical protein